MIGVDLSVWHMAITTERELLDRKLARAARIGAMPRRSGLSRIFRRDASARGGAIDAPPARFPAARGA
jgi:hypothetical protein